MEGGREGGRDPPKSRIKNRESKRRNETEPAHFHSSNFYYFEYYSETSSIFFFSSLPPPTQPFPSLSFKFDRLYKFDSIETRSYYFSPTKEAKRVSRISRISGKIGTLSSLVMYRDSRHSISKSVGRSAPTTKRKKESSKRIVPTGVCVCVSKRFETADSRGRRISFSTNEKKDERPKKESRYQLMNLLPLLPLDEKSVGLRSLLPETRSPFPLLVSRALRQ